MTEIKERFLFMCTGIKSKDVFEKATRDITPCQPARLGVPEPHLNRKRDTDVKCKKGGTVTINTLDL